MAEKILQVCLSASWGGLEMVALETAEILKDHKTPCITVVLPGCPLAEKLVSKNCDVLIWDSSTIQNIRALRKLFQHNHIKSVLVQQLRDLFFLRIALLGFPEIRVIGISHTFVGVSKKDPYHKWIYSRVQTLIALTDVHRKNLIDHLAIDPQKIAVIPNSVDTEKFNPKHRSEPLRSSFSANEDTVLIGLIGRLDKAKGQKLLLEASAILKKSFTNFKVLLVGEETLNEPGILGDLKSTSTSLGLDDHVIFTGYRSDIPAIMASLDIVVMSSDAETFGRVIIEGMASGAAVIASGAGGVVDIIDDGMTGLLFTPGSVSELAEKALTFCVNPDIRKTCALNAISKTQARYQRPVNDKLLLKLL